MAGVDVAEHDALHAPRDERDAGPWAGQMLGRPGRAQPRRRDTGERPQRARRREAAQQQGRTEAPAVWEHLEDEPPQQALSGAARAAGFDVRARRLDQPVVLHPRGAGWDTRHAAEAAVEVLDHRVGELERPVDEAAHQVDAPSRRVHLLVPERVRRARRQAEAAVDAVRDQLGLHRASSTRSASGLQAVAAASST